MKKRRKECRFIRLSKTIFIITFIVYVFVGTYLNSSMASTNIKVQRIENEIQQLNADVDGLDMKYVELTNFQKIYEIAKNNGYIYHHSSTAAAVTKK